MASLPPLVAVGDPTNEDTTINSMLYQVSFNESAGLGDTGSGAGMTGDIGNIGNLRILSGCRLHPKGRWLPFGNLPVLKSRKAYCQWAGKTYRPERASCPRWPESSSMTPLRLYWICPLTVSRDNKNQRKSPNALTRSLLPSSLLRHPGIFEENIRDLLNSFTHPKEHQQVVR